MIFARYIRPGLSLLLFMTILLGVIYPMVITGVGMAAFPTRAAGSLIYEGKTLIGSKLIGQHFSEAKYFWGRPSATAPQPYNGLASGGSNLGPLNPALIDNVKAASKLYKDADPTETRPIPIELVTASASGLDPDISPAAANYQIARVARARGLSADKVQALVMQHVKPPLLGILGEPTVNVLELNIALDHLP
jgi:K+-transporting ATPase ATPase C chain